MYEIINIHKKAPIDAINALTNFSDRKLNFISSRVTYFIDKKNFYTEIYILI